MFDPPTFFLYYVAMRVIEKFNDQRIIVSIIKPVEVAGVRIICYGDVT